MNATVTVIMPSYNSAGYISEAIESVLKQTFQDFEFLIIDGGSTDATLKIARSYAEHDNRLKIILQENVTSNPGVSAARNIGVKLASKPIIAFIDADDVWLSEKLAQHVAHFNSDSVLGISFARVEILGINGNKGALSRGILCNLQPQHFLYENPTIVTSNVVVRKEVFDRVGYFDEAMSYAEDLDWLLRVICKGLKVEGINQILTRYRTTEGGLSSCLERMEEGWERLVEKAKHYAPELVEQHYYRARAIHLRYLARRAFRFRYASPIGVDFINRSVRSDWKLILHEPRRTLLTLLAVYAQHLLSDSWR